MDIQSLGAMIRGMADVGHVFRFNEHEFVQKEGALKNLATRFSVPLAHLPYLSDEALAQHLLYGTPYALPTEAEQGEVTPETADSGNKKGKASTANGG